MKHWAKEEISDSRYFVETWQICHLLPTEYVSSPLAPSPPHYTGMDVYGASFYPKVHTELCLLVGHSIDSEASSSGLV